MQHSNFTYSELSRLLKRVIGLLIGAFFIYQPTQGQNLVPNGGFEEGVNCPTFIGNLDEECDSWYASISLGNGLSPTPDWFHSCSEFDVLSPPNTAFGFQEAYEGDGYGGFIAYKIEENMPGYREHIGVGLLEPLITGQTYNCGFWMARFYSGSTGFAVDNIGFKFTTYPAFTSNNLAVNNTALFSIDTVFADTASWHRVQVEFLADSAYGYLHIGNFFDDNNTTILQEGEFSNLSYYIVDNVEVTSTLNMTSDKSGGELVLYPNPVTSVLTVDLNHINASPNISFSIADITGAKVFSNQVKTNSSLMHISVEHLNSGVYFIFLQTDKYKYYDKFVKTN